MASSCCASEPLAKGAGPWPQLSWCGSHRGTQHRTGVIPALSHSTAFPTQGSCSFSSRLPTCCLHRLSPGLRCGAEGQEGKETLSHHLGWRGQGGCPSWAAQSPASPTPSCCPGRGCPSCSSCCPWGCPGLILRLWDVILEEKMDSAGLPGLEYEFWLAREDADPAWGSPGCSVGLLKHPWPLRQHRAEALACLVSSTAHRKAGSVFMFSCFAKCFRWQGVILSLKQPFVW